MSAYACKFKLYNVHRVDRYVLINTELSVGKFDSHLTGFHFVYCLLYFTIIIDDLQ